MPRVSVIAVRLSLLWLVAAAVVGGSRQLAPLMSAAPLGPIWTRVHAEWMVTGWTTSFALGVAWWMLPKIQGQRSTRLHALMPTAIAALHSGLVLTTAGLLAAAPMILASGRVVTAAALMAAAVALAPRVRAFAQGATGGG